MLQYKGLARLVNASLGRWPTNRTYAFPGLSVCLPKHLTYSLSLLTFPGFLALVGEILD